MYYVYKHTNKLNGKTYIGITCKKPERRWGPNGNRYFRCKHFFSAIQKYGWSNFSHEVLYSNLSKDDAEKKEIELIAKYKQLHMSYNISDGGKANKGWKPSQETKDKMSKTHLGKKLSDEHKRKISESGKGRIVSYSTKQKISCSKIGHEVSQETRNKIGEKSREYFKTHNSAFKGKHHTKESIKLNILHQKRIVTYMYDIFGNLIRIYNSKSEITRENKFCLSSVNKCCKMNKDKKLNDCKIYKDYIFSEQIIYV